MKPFNLEKALAGEPVVTRDGKEVSEIYFFKTSEGVFPIVAVIEGNKHGYTKEGWFSAGHILSNKDLFMKEKVIEGWCNIYQEGDSIWISHPHESEERAKKTIMYDSKYIKTIKITNEK